MNPGGATAADAIGPPPAAASSPPSAATMASAIASGGRRSGRASFIARFVARSPCSAFAGRSTSTDGRGRVVRHRRQRAGLHGPRPGRLDRVAHARANRRWDGRGGRGRRARLGVGRDRRHGPLMLAATASDGVRPGPLAARGPARRGFRRNRVSSAGPDPSVTSSTAIGRHPMCGAVDSCGIRPGNRVFPLVLFLIPPTYDPAPSTQGNRHAGEPQVPGLKWALTVLLSLPGSPRDLSKGFLSWLSRGSGGSRHGVSGYLGLHERADQEGIDPHLDGALCVVPPVAVLLVRDGRSGARRPRRRPVRARRQRHRLGGARRRTGIDERRGGGLRTSSSPARPPRPQPTTTPTSRAAARRTSTTSRAGRSLGQRRRARTRTS